MKRLIITKLIVISQSESRSLEIPFSEGLNIIYGGNKTGKSSIIKSMFTSLGCECKRMESEWKKLISTYILSFKYGNNIFYIVREGRKFQIFEKENDSFTCIIETQKFHEYSNCLMKILGVNMPCISKEGENFNITPPLLFRFQYIDQDEGWSKIAEPFNNTGYIKDWKKNTNKYVCGYQDERYYSLMAQVAQLEMEKNEKKKELTYNQNFVTRISDVLTQIESSDTIEGTSSNIEEMIAQAEELRENQFGIKYKMAILENEIYINQHKLNITTLNLDETEKDINFAMSQESVLICPICGAKYDNGLNEQLNISSDYAHCEKLIKSLKDAIETDAVELEKIQNEYSKFSEKISSVEQKIQKSQKLLSYSEFYKNKGQCEIYESCQQQLNVIQNKLDKNITEIAKLEERINDLKSKKRSNEIREQIKSYCRTLAGKINIPQTYIKIRDFVQVIDHTGSETPRLVYMYQSALYLYNLNRLESPFNFFVIDTPNQQGQDSANLESIFKSLELFLSDDGQVILGTERKTGLEDKATSVITLKDRKRCLNDTKYSEHIDLLENLQKIAIEWVADNFEDKI